MEVFINGESKNVPQNTSIAKVLDFLSLTGKRVAVELNGEIVPKGLHASTTLQEGYRLEIVIAVGGG